MRSALLFALIFALPAPAAAFAPDKPNRPGSAMVCRDIQATGSRLATSRICKTKEQWEEERRQVQADIAYGQTRVVTPCPPNTRC